MRRRKASARDVVNAAREAAEQWRESSAEIAEQWRKGQAELAEQTTNTKVAFWHSEIAKYTAERDEALAQGKEGKAKRVQRVIDRCERKLAEELGKTTDR